MTEVEQPSTLQPSARGRRDRMLLGAGAGLLALIALLGVAEVVAIITGPESAPSIAIGQSAINHTPTWLREFAVRRFGESDKTALLVGIYTTLTILAAAVGAIAAITKRLVATIAVATLGVVAALAAAHANISGPLSFLPSLAGAVAAVWVLGLLIRDSPRRIRINGDPVTGIEAVAGMTRRRLFTLAATTAGLGAAAYAVGRLGLQSAYSAIASRNAVTLPQPTSPLPEPAGSTGFDIDGLASYVTANSSFYRVDTALVVPEIQTAHWQLQIHGMVTTPITLTYGDILSMPMIERAVTLTCVSDPVGGHYIGNARWLGTLIKPVLERAGVSPDADQIFMTSHDGMTIGADLKAAMDGRDAMLAIGMNGEPLPFEHGFPVRMIVPGFYGYASACKWLTDIEITTYAEREAYWVPRGYAATAPVKLEARIDTPHNSSTVSAGMVPVAGVAWRQHVGVSKVEVAVDGGAWNEAALADVDSVDTWRLWHWDWPATIGKHVLAVRATDMQGNIQTTQQTSILPNGATGLQQIGVTVT